jgi:hypothetical protein
MPHFSFHFIMIASDVERAEEESEPALEEERKL